ncbi:MAG: AsmA family protein, partial [Desulfobulbaceae bacterium]|nr:AsmA family protein [Desulfobulbaceae bacterium]
LTLSRLLLNLDQSTVEGTAAVTGLAGKPAYELAVHVDQIDLDSYKMKKAAETAGQSTPPPAAPAAAPAAAATEPPLIPVEMLRGLNFTADIRIDTLKAAKMSLADIELKASGRDGLVKLEPLSAGPYGGTINVSADLDSRPAVPTARVAKTLKGVQLGPMLRDITGKEEVKGRADITADITTRGLTRQELTRNANGTMNLALADGEIAKLKIIDTIRTARTLIGSKDIGAVLQQQAAPQTSGRPTSFAALTGSGVITNGVFHNNDLVAESELMKATGKGTVDLVNERIDYLLTIYLAKAIDRDQETGLVDLADTPIPYRVKGTFDNIEQTAVLEEIVKTGAKKALLRELEKQLGGDKPEEGAKKEPTDPARDLINRGLKGIFGK